MIDYVIDASTAVKVFLKEALTAEAEKLFELLQDPPQANFHVPDLFFVECANIFWKQVSRGGCTATEAVDFLEALRGLAWSSVVTYALMPDALELALQYAITAYDACYVVLADRLGFPLITADQKLIQKLAGSSHNVIFLGDWKPPGP